MTDTAIAEPETLSQDYIAAQGCQNLTLVRTPVRRDRLGEGTDFITTQPDRIVFREGRFTATNQEDIDWLDDHPSHGVLFHKVGFGEGGRTEDNSAAVIQQVVKLAFSGDYQKIADILIAERSSYSRADVIAACETVLSEIDAGTGAPTE